MPHIHTVPEGKRLGQKGGVGVTQNHNFGALFDSILVEIESLRC